MNLLFQATVSVFCSATVLGVFAFIVKKYFDRYISYRFDSKLHAQRASDEVRAKLKKEFLTKALNVYEETARLTYRCRLAGRDALNDIVGSSSACLDECWECLGELQRYFENSAFVDERDYALIHAYKNTIEQYFRMCQAYVDRTIRGGDDSAEERRRIQVFWTCVVEESYKHLQTVFRVYSLKSDA